MEKYKLLNYVSFLEQLNQVDRNISEKLNEGKPVVLYDGLGNGDNTEVNYEFVRLYANNLIAAPGNKNRNTLYNIFLIIREFLKKNGSKSEPVDIARKKLFNNSNYLIIKDKQFVHPEVYLSSDNYKYIFTLRIEGDSIIAENPKENTYLAASTTYTEIYNSGLIYDNPSLGAVHTMYTLPRPAAKLFDIKNIEFIDRKIYHLDLTDADLTGVGFIRTRLSDAWFDNTILNDVVFQNTTLTYNKLANSDLTSVEFSECEIFNCDMSGVNAEGVDFDRVNIASTDMSNGNFKGADFSDCPKLQTVNFKNSDLSNTNFFRTELDTVDLSEATINGANFSHAKMGGTMLVNTQAIGTDFKNAELNYSDFTNANLQNANFTNAELYKAIFKGANIEGAIFEGVNMDGIIWE